jgi:hypothetical protein
VFTTRSGGQIAVLNGMPLSGAGVFGFATAETLDGLALTSDFTAPASVLLANDQVTVPPAEPIRVRFLGGPAGGAGHVFVSNARLPALAPTALPAPFTGTGLAWVDLWDPMLVWSAIMPSFTLPLDASGDGELLFGATQISLGLRIVVQGVVVPGFAVTEPVVLETN